MNEAVADGRGDCLPTPLYFTQQFAGGIDVAALLQPPLHAGNDRGVDVSNRPRQYSSLNGHVQCRRDQGEAIDDADDLGMRATGYLRHFRQLQPRSAEPFEFRLNPLGRKPNKMTQPIVANTAMTFVRCRVEPFAGGRDLLLGDGLECAFRLNYRRDIDETNQLACPGVRKEFRHR